MQSSLEWATHSRRNVLLVAASLGLAGAAGCGNDKSGGTNASGGSSSSGGNTNSGGGTDTGGSTGTGGNTGDSGTGGSTGGAGTGGATGDSGTSDAAPRIHPAKLNGADGILIPQVNDLRGLTYSSTGKIYASGHVGGSAALVDRELAVVRFDADGTLDGTFDNDGIRTFNLRGRTGIDANDGDEYSMGIVELADGSLIVLANVRDASGFGRDVYLLRLTSNGYPSNFTAVANDPAYPASPLRRIDFGWKPADDASFPGAPAAQPTDESWGIALDTSGTEAKIVVFGYGPAKLGELDTSNAQRIDNDRYVVRVLAGTGQVDPTFNGGVPYTFNSGDTNNDNARRGRVEPDGSIVSAGYTSLAGLGNTAFMLGLTETGAPDPAFTYNDPSAPAIPGVFVSNPFSVDGGVAECYAVTRQSTGRYVTTGYGRATAASTVSTLGWQTTDAVDMVSLGFTTSSTGGAKDSTFGQQSTFVVQSEGLNNASTEDRGRDLLALPDDRLVFAGRLGDYPAIFVATAGGALDATAGGLEAGPGGSDTIPGAYTYAPLPGTTSHFFALAVSPDKKRVAATTGNHEAGVVLALLDVE